MNWIEKKKKKAQQHCLKGSLESELEIHLIIILINQSMYIYWDSSPIGPKIFWKWQSKTENASSPHFTTPKWEYMRGYQRDIKAKQRIKPRSCVIELDSLVEVVTFEVEFKW